MKNKVFFNNSCNICRAEINHYKKHSNQDIEWVDVTNNKVSGLRRGTAGTAASSHDVGAVVYDYSVTTYLNFDYAKTLYNQPTIDDGSSSTNGKALQNTNTVPAKFLRGQ